MVRLRNTLELDSVLTTYRIVTVRDLLAFTKSFREVQTAKVCDVTPIFLIAILNFIA